MLRIVASFECSLGKLKLHSLHYLYLGRCEGPPYSYSWTGGGGGGGTMFASRPQVLDNHTTPLGMSSIALYTAQSEHEPANMDRLGCIKNITDSQRALHHSFLQQLFEVVSRLIKTAS